MYPAINRDTEKFSTIYGCDCSWQARQTFMCSFIQQAKLLAVPALKEKRESPCSRRKKPALLSPKKL
ncbi:hypothetical protein ANCCAN_23734 [Ancylostoma caninum]|uniref:Uncharacterized protein n=1 Tax=Ancylostoma caninum TaxID=29170 RepID=A0A368FG08_ANCCA|nr:hypothetical protein ANCCAN_23734 [Ancylostoma caninum]